MNTASKKIASYICKNKSKIALGAGIGLMISGTVAAVPATVKAVRAVDEEKRKKNVDKLSKKDIIRVSWKCYIPTFVIEAAGFTSLIFSGKFSADEIATIATVCKVNSEAAEAYQKKVQETVGTQKEELIASEILRDKVNSNPPPKPEEVTVNSSSAPVVVENGMQLCYDQYSGRYFYTSPNIIGKAVNELNNRLYGEMFVSMNDFYNEVGLKPLDIYEKMGWNIDNGIIRYRLISTLSEDDVAVLSYEFTRPFEPEGKWF